MRILVTNDDGIDGIGLHVLARRLQPLGDVVVAAPDREFSGCGAALGTLWDDRPEVRRVELDDIETAWSVGGPPGLCVLFARLGVFGGTFDLVVSGINPGVNAGRAIYHSGTVGAALTARNGRVTGIAISQATVDFGVEGQGWGDQLAGQRWETAAEVAAVVTQAVIDEPPSPEAVINVNVPNCGVEEIAGWTRTYVENLPPRTVSAATLVPMPGHEDAFNVAMEWGETNVLPPESDSGAVEAGRVSLTYLTRLEADDRADLGHVEKALTGLVGTVET